MNKVVVFQYRLLHYRVALFELLRKKCQAKGIDFHLVHGQASRRELAKKDEGSLPWAHKVENRFWEMGRRDLLWQLFPKDLKDANLVVVMQESRILSNYPLLFKRHFGGQKVAYWGHGRNFQTHQPSGLLERWKKAMVGQVDWWFAYTDMTKDILLVDGYPAERITILNNAIDNEGFQRDLASVSDEQLVELRAEINADEQSPVGVFCGSLYPDKRLDYMIQAADRIHAEVPKFRLVVLGDGPCAMAIEAAARTRSWLKWVGMRKGREKAGYFRLATVVLNPSLVGLHVLDSFCAGVPMVTTAEARHGPEIAYLKNGENGLVVCGGSDSYAEAVLGLLRNQDALEDLRLGTQEATKRYTLQNMVERFAKGIERCLEMPKKT